MFLKGNINIKKNVEKYLNQYRHINFSIITYYEILSGLKHKDANKQLGSFFEFASLCHILPLTIKSSEISSIIYADLRKQGKPLDDIDLLIAGIAIENDMVLVSNNARHFSRIEGLDITNWTVLQD